MILSQATGGPGSCGGVRDLNGGDSMVLCTRKIVIKPLDAAFQYAIRPDVAEETVINLLEQVMFSVGGQVKKIEPKVRAEESTGDASYYNVDITEDNALPSPTIHVDLAIKQHSDVTSITCHIGVNSSTKQRVVVLYFSNVYSNPGNLSYFNSSLGSNSESFGAYTKSVVDCVKTAFDAEKIASSYAGTLNSKEADLLDLAGLAPSSNQGANNIDAKFVRDLQLAHAYDMFVSTSNIAMPIDRQVSILEKQCAKLMTILKPSYNRCEITMSNPPQKRSIKNYALALTRTPISKPLLETSKLILFRARKAAKKSVTTDLSSSLPASSSPLDVDLFKLTIFEVHSQLHEWAEEEALIRIKRKTKAVQDRLIDIEQFRLELLWTLHTRYANSRLPCPIIMSSSSSSSSGGVGNDSFNNDGGIDSSNSNSSSNVALNAISEKVMQVSYEDQHFMSELHSKCRLFRDIDPALVDIPISFFSISHYNPSRTDLDFFYNSMYASSSNKNGHLYISSSHIYCESSLVTAVKSSLLGSIWSGLGYKDEAVSGDDTSSSSSSSSLDIAIKSIQSISIVDSNNLRNVCVDNILNPTTNSNASSLVSMPDNITPSPASSSSSSNISSYSLLIVDKNETAYVITCRSDITDSQNRLADLIHLLIRFDLYSLSSQLPSESQIIPQHEIIVSDGGTSRSRTSSSIDVHTDAPSVGGEGEGKRGVGDSRSEVSVAVESSQGMRGSICIGNSLADSGNSDVSNKGGTITIDGVSIRESDILDATSGGRGGGGGEMGDTALVYNDIGTNSPTLNMSRSSTTTTSSSSSSSSSSSRGIDSPGINQFFDNLGLDSSLRVGPIEKTSSSHPDDIFDFMSSSSSSSTTSSSSPVGIEEKKNSTSSGGSSSGGDIDAFFDNLDSICTKSTDSQKADTNTAATASSAVSMASESDFDLDIFDVKVSSVSSSSSSNLTNRSVSVSTNTSTYTSSSTGTSMSACFSGTTNRPNPNPNLNRFPYGSASGNSNSLASSSNAFSFFDNALVDAKRAPVSSIATAASASSANIATTTATVTSTSGVPSSNSNSNSGGSDSNSGPNSIASSSNASVVAPASETKKAGGGGGAMAKNIKAFLNQTQQKKPQ